MDLRPASILAGSESSERPKLRCSSAQDDFNAAAPSQPAPAFQDFITREATRKGYILVFRIERITAQRVLFALDNVVAHGDLWVTAPAEYCVLIAIQTHVPGTLDKTKVIV